MTLWYKQGVAGRLNPKSRKALGRIHKEYQKRGQDVFVTSIEEGNHGAGSLRYCGDAFDIRHGVPHHIPDYDLREVVGDDFDVVFEKDHVHVEYDPK